MKGTNFMLNTKKLLTAVFAFVIIGSLSLTASAEGLDYGALAVVPGETYSLKQMLTYSL